MVFSNVKNMDYKETLNLPKTDFPMKASLPQREPDTLKRWKEQDIYGRIQKKRKKARKKYVLHDGPPYSNGDIHMGHVLNKILKDIVVKFSTMAGYNVPFIPGWDCHGLPVEHQLMKDLNIEKGDIPQIEFRKKAKDFALKYVKIQRSQFERLGVFGDWNNPYLTLDSRYEASIVRAFATLVGRGYIYKDLKPVNWCFKCETALAEAEVEYDTRTSPSVYVKFKLLDTAALKKVLRTELAGEIKDNVFVLIWTTTPWTLVSNVAIALSPDMKYSLAENDGSYFILARDLLETVRQKADLQNMKELALLYSRHLEWLDCQHPFIDRKSKIVLAEYVSHEEGTGCVHTAPGHGHEDYITGRKYNLPTIMPVDSKGRFDDTAGQFKHMHVFEANTKIINTLKEKGLLVCEEGAEHSYPHCWRCKNPIIFRATSQYFMSVDHNDLRSKVNNAVTGTVRWVPDAAKERISAMVENRPDWCLSRQRLWGVPIVSFYCSRCGELLLEEGIINHVADIFEKEGSDVWFTRSSSGLLPKGTRCRKCKNDKFDKESDILDVWFESGVSHQAVLKPRKEFPADLYLEGSDQHRGWFQSAILSSMAIDGTAPYKSVLTHGFVVDGEGKKMSKSVGNVISPEDVMKKYGADILRIWVASCDYKDDVRISEEILSRLAEAYRKIRNTCRFILGNVHDFDPAKNEVGADKWSEIDRWALWRASAMAESAERNFRDFVFHRVFGLIYNFCVVDMSSIYLDILKDVLYTAGRDSLERRSAQSALYDIINILTRVMAPILGYTAEEVFRLLPGTGAEESIHMADWPDIKKFRSKISHLFNEAQANKWDQMLLPLRDCVLKKLEESRGKNIIGSSLEAKVILQSDDREWQKLLSGSKDLFSKLFIVSSTEVATLLQDSKEPETIPVNIKIARADGNKCQRCWNYSPSVGTDAEDPGLCSRCADIVKHSRSN